MAIFLVTSLGGTPAWGKTLAEKYPDDHLQIAPNEWLVAANITAKTLSDHLGISKGVSGSGAVFLVSSYFGWANPEIWEWLNLKWRAGERACWNG